MRRWTGTAAIAAGLIAAGLIALWPDPACAAEGGVDGAKLGLPWGIPFAGILLSIALFPLLAPQTWHHHFGKIAAFWSLAFLVPFAVVYGIGNAWDALLHTALFEYVPFILLIYALFVVAGGIWVNGDVPGTPLNNLYFLAFGTLIASLVGTTGAAMLLIRPLIAANRERRHNQHVFVFFIFLVANIGGALSPVGDPPLYLGFLKGIDFFWPLQNMLGPMLLVAVPLLAIVFALDSWLYAREGRPFAHRDEQAPIRIRGAHNIVYISMIVGVVLASGVFSTGIVIPVAGQSWPLESLLRGIALVAIGVLSLRTTKPEIRIANAFTWFPIQEVAVLFAAIFITIIPALAILNAGAAGEAAPLVALVTSADGRPIDAYYFWITGGLSSFLDNAPTYLVFFQLAGGDPAALQTDLANTLLAISCGAVFMGANTYIGNAPNFMVKSICDEKGIRMPSFFGYMGWSAVFLLPLFALVTWVYFTP